MIRDLQTDHAGGPPGDNETWRSLRERMVEQQLRRRGIRDERVLQAMRDVLRHAFVPPSLRHQSYEDHPLPIGWNQTISQPYMVAYMAEKLELTEAGRVLEIGTGCGYQAAILGRIARSVHTMEIIPALAAEAELRLRQQGCDHVHCHTGDGYFGWPPGAPYQGIIVTAAPVSVPAPLLSQLAPGGRLIIPLGSASQYLARFTARSDGHFEEEALIPVRFVPFTRES